MKKRYLLFVILLQTLMLHSQDNEQSNKSLLLRGKATTFFIIEDLYFNNWSVGLEYRFANRHSFGIDFVHFRWRHEHDIYVDGMETGSGPDSYSRRQYAFVDYHYYPFMNMMRKHHIEPYFNAFAKIGKRKIWTNDPYTLYSDNDISSVRNQRSTFIDYGMALGIHVDLSESEIVGFDANIGAVYRETQIQYQESYDYDNAIYTEVYSGNNSYWKFYMRLNLYVRLVNFK